MGHVKKHTQKMFTPTTSENMFVPFIFVSNCFVILNSITKNVTKVRPFVLRIVLEFYSVD